MSHSYSNLRNLVSSMTLIVGGLLATGCMDAPASEPTAEGAEVVVIDERGAVSLPAQAEVRLTRTSAGETFSIASPGWSETAPGIWSSAAQGDAGGIIVGAEGHRSAIERAEKELAALHDRAARQQDEAVTRAIAQKEAYLDTLKGTAQAIGTTEDGTALVTSCNIGFLNGPSSPYMGFIGAFGAAQVSCTGGCQWVTIEAEACTNFGCTGVYAASNYVCSTPWTYGVATSGSYGASCYGAARVSPFGITGYRYFPCG